MNLTVWRDQLRPDSTEGQFYVDGVQKYYTLEDTYRQLDNGTVDKQYGTTCIPNGRYRVVPTASPHFGRVMPHVENVPQFDGVLIHWGNRPADTEGCILLGMQRGADLITDSQAAFDDFWALYIAAIQRGEEVWLTVGVTQPS